MNGIQIILPYIKLYLRRLGAEKPSSNTEEGDDADQLVAPQLEVTKRGDVQTPVSQKQAPLSKNKKSKTKRILIPSHTVVSDLL